MTQVRSVSHARLVASGDSAPDAPQDSDSVDDVVDPVAYWSAVKEIADSWACIEDDSCPELEPLI